MGTSKSLHKLLSSAAVLPALMLSTPAVQSQQNTISTEAESSLVLQSSTQRLNVRYNTYILVAGDQLQIEQLNVQSITGPEDVSVKGDAAALFTGEAGSLTGFRRCWLSPQRQRCQHQAGCECSDGQPGPNHVICTDGVKIWLGRL